MYLNDKFFNCNLIIIKKLFTYKFCFLNALPLFFKINLRARDGEMGLIFNFAYFPFQFSIRDKLCENNFSLKRERKEEMFVYHQQGNKQQH